MKKSSRISELWLLAVSVFAVPVGCGKDESGKSSCPAGSERCACYGNDTCDDGLVCASSVCVSMGGGSAGADSGSKGGAAGTAGEDSTSEGGTAGAAGEGSTSEGGAAGTAGEGSTSEGGTAGAAGEGSTSEGGTAGVAGQTSTGGTETGTCGNGVVEGLEICEPGGDDNDLGDGNCTPTCTLEPSCPKAGGPCTSKCGDGLVFDGEACDDGNVKNGDGCSSSCKVESGFTCAQPALGTTMLVPMVVRDFGAGGDFEKGSYFSSGLTNVNQGLLETTLDARGLKPVLASTVGTLDDSGIASAASFAQWYDDAAPASGNTYQATLATALRLFLSDDKTGYVNRFGSKGDGLTSAKYQTITTQICVDEAWVARDADGQVMPCHACYVDADPDTPECEGGAEPCLIGSVEPDTCELVNGTYMGSVAKESFDGNPLFFPADAITPYSPAGEGQISGTYDISWPRDGGNHNFAFTTEIRFWFKYDASQEYSFEIVGDDDIWAFVNKRLAIDMGGIHTPTAGRLTIASGAGTATATVTPTLDSGTQVVNEPELGGLVDGGVYEIAIFQAERQMRGSSLKITLPGFNTGRSVCSRK